MTAGAGELLQWLFVLNVNGCCVHCSSPVLLVQQERLLGEDGNPRKTKENEDPFRMGLVLEWVYGTIVSTAEKARDSAKKSLGKSCSLNSICCMANANASSSKTASLSVACRGQGATRACTLALPPPAHTQVFKFCALESCCKHWPDCIFRFCLNIFQWACRAAAAVPGGGPRHAVRGAAGAGQLGAARPRGQGAPARDAQEPPRGRRPPAAVQHQVSPLPLHCAAHPSRQ